MKNVYASNYIADGVKKNFQAYGLNTADPAYCLVIVGKVTQTFNTDYIILPNFSIELTATPPAGRDVSIYSFEAATQQPSVSTKDNITVVVRSSYTTDGTVNSFPAGGVLDSADNCIVTAGAGPATSGYIYQFNKDYTIVNNNIVFNSILPRNMTVSVLFFSRIVPATRGGVPNKDYLAAIKRTDMVANGTDRTYTIGDNDTNSKALYCLVALNGRMLQGGTDFIISHGRVKFVSSVPRTGANLTFISFIPAPPTIIPPALTDRVRYLDKSANLNERTLYRNYWREQIAQYGMLVNYYTNLTTKANADIIYGEAPIAGYAEPEKLNIAIKIDSESSLFSKFGLSTDTDSTCIIHHDDFQEVFGVGSEPKSGDLIEFTEIGEDRLNYPKRGPRIMEITLKNDEIVGEINNLAGHYVWQISLKRFDYSRENTIIPELGTIAATDTGETIPGVDNPIEVLSNKIFNYVANTCSNDNVYGDY